MAGVHKAQNRIEAQHIFAVAKRNELTESGRVSRTYDFGARAFGLGWETKLARFVSRSGHPKIERERERGQTTHWLCCFARGRQAVGDFGAVAFSGDKYIVKNKLRIAFAVWQANGIVDQRAPGISAWVFCHRGTNRDCIDRQRKIGCCSGGSENRRSRADDRGLDAALAGAALFLDYGKKAAAEQIL